MSSVKTVLLLLFLFSTSACNRGFKSTTGTQSTNSTVTTQVETTQPPPKETVQNPNPQAALPPVTTEKKEIADTTQKIAQNTNLDDYIIKDLIKFMVSYSATPIVNLPQFFNGDVIYYSNIDPRYYDTYYYATNYLNSLDDAHRALFYSDLNQALNYAYDDRDWILSNYWDAYDVYDYGYYFY